MVRCEVRITLLHRVGRPAPKFLRDVKGVGRLKFEVRHRTPHPVSVKCNLTTRTSHRLIACRSKPCWQLNFHHASVSREVSRAKSCASASAACYRANRAPARSVAQRTAAGAARRKLGSDVKTPLWRMVVEGLRCHWSLERSAGELPRMSTAATPLPAHLADKLSVSHETIYCAIYAMPRGTLRTELVGLLRNSHKTRLPRARGSARAGGLPKTRPRSTCGPRRSPHASFPGIGRATSSRAR